MTYELTPEQIQIEMTGYANQREYLTEISEELRQIQDEVRAFNHRQKMILNEKFPNVFHFRIIHPCQYSKAISRATTNTKTPKI